MTNQISELYFEWMCDQVCDDEHSEYKSLLHHLNNREFVVSNPSIIMDENRYDDGVNLRYLFDCRSRRISNSEIAKYLDNRPCSVLEMMVALAVRVEDTIRADTAIWLFWEMIESLGLTGMDEDHYNFRYVEECVDKLINRCYASNGKGGLFTVRNHRRDMRDVDIWCQLMWFLNENGG